MLNLLSKHKLLLAGTVVSVIGGLISCVRLASAATSYRTGLKTLGESLGLQGNANLLIGNIILGALGLIGIVVLILIIYAGFMWLVSQGDPTKITKAKNIMIYAFIGLAIILTSYLIAHYVIFNVLLGSK